MTGDAVQRQRARAFAGIALVVSASLCFSVLDTTTKFVTASVPLLMAVWFRYAFQAVATALVVFPMRGARVLRTRHPKFQVLRGLLLFMSTMFGFASLRYLPVAEFTAILMIVPLAITLLAATVLKESVSPVRWMLVAGGFAGSLIIIRPGAETFQWASLLPFGLVATNAWFQVLTSKLARTEDPITMHLYTGWVGAAAASVALPFVWAALPDPTLWLLLCVMGFLGTVGHFILILAYQRAPAATLTPYLYTQIGFAMLAGWLVFSHVPDRWAMVGIVMIAVCGAGGAWLTVRESRVQPEPVQP